MVAKQFRIVLVLRCVVFLQYLTLSETGCVTDISPRTHVRFYRNQTGHLISEVNVEKNIEENLVWDAKTWLVDVQHEPRDSNPDRNYDKIIISLKKHPSGSEPTRSPLTPTTTTATTTTPSSLPPRDAPEGSVPLPGVGHYKYYSTSLKWPAAQVVCAEDGGHLVVIDSREELDIVKSFSTGWIWIGVQERGVHGTYYTVKGDLWNFPTFLEWSPGQPNFYGGNDCILLRNGQIGDTPCEEYRRAFVCEYPWN